MKNAFILTFTRKQEGIVLYGLFDRYKGISTGNKTFKEESTEIISQLKTRKDPRHLLETA